MVAMIDQASLEAAIAEGERRASEVSAAPGVKWISGRIGVQCIRSMTIALTSELERGSSPGDVAEGFVPMFASTIAGAVVNSDADIDDISKFIWHLSSYIAEEAIARAVAIRSGDPRTVNVAMIQGGHG